MSKSGLLILTLFLSAGGITATPMPCGTGTAATYTTTVDAAGGCTEGNLLFSQFAYISTNSGTALALPSTALAISPLLNPGGTGLGFQIVGGFAATAGGLADGVLQYEVSTLDNSASLNGISLAFNGVATGTGIATVSENYCVGGTGVPPTTCGSGLKNIAVQSTAGLQNLQASAAYGGSTSVTVSKDIQVNGGTAGTATISMASNQFQTSTTPGSNAPEPGTLLLFAGPLLAFGIFRRRRTKK